MEACCLLAISEPGAFPIVVPVDPYAPDDISTQWHWTAGQVMMLDVVHHLREFWRNVLDAVRRDAFIDAKLFEQTPPLVLDTPPSSLVAGAGIGPWATDELQTRAQCRAVAQYSVVSQSAESSCGQ